MRVKIIESKFYVVDESDNIVSGPYDTFSEAQSALATGPSTSEETVTEPTATPEPEPTSTPASGGTPQINGKDITTRRLTSSQYQYEGQDHGYWIYVDGSRAAGPYPTEQAAMIAAQVNPPQEVLKAAGALPQQRDPLGSPEFAAQATKALREGDPSILDDAVARSGGASTGGGGSSAGGASTGVGVLSSTRRKQFEEWRDRLQGALDATVTTQAGRTEKSPGVAALQSVLTDQLAQIESVLAGQINPDQIPALGLSLPAGTDQQVSALLAQHGLLLDPDGGVVRPSSQAELGELGNLDTLEQQFRSGGLQVDFGENLGDPTDDFLRPASSGEQAMFASRSAMINRMARRYLSGDTDEFRVQDQAMQFAILQEARRLRAEENSLLGDAILQSGQNLDNFSTPTGNLSTTQARNQGLLTPQIDATNADPTLLTGTNFPDIITLPDGRTASRAYYEQVYLPQQAAAQVGAPQFQHGTGPQGLVLNEPAVIQGVQSGQVHGVVGEAGEQERLTQRPNSSTVDIQPLGTPQTSQGLERFRLPPQGLVQFDVGGFIGQEPSEPTTQTTDPAPFVEEPVVQTTTNNDFQSSGGPTAGTVQPTNTSPSFATSGVSLLNSGPLSPNITNTFQQSRGGPEPTVDPRRVLMDSIQEARNRAALEAAAAQEGALETRARQSQDYKFGVAGLAPPTDIRISDALAAYFKQYTDPVTGRPLRGLDSPDLLQLMNLPPGFRLAPGELTLILGNSDIPDEVKRQIAQNAGVDLGGRDRDRDRDRDRRRRRPDLEVPDPREGLPPAATQPPLGAGLVAV